MESLAQSVFYQNDKTLVFNAKRNSEIHENMHHVQYLSGIEISKV